MLMCLLFRKHLWHDAYTMKSWCVVDGPLTEYRNNKISLALFLYLFPPLLRIYGRFHPCKILDYLFIHTNNTFTSFEGLYDILRRGRWSTCLSILWWSRGGTTLPILQGRTRGWIIQAEKFQLLIKIHTIWYEMRNLSYFVVKHCVQ